MYLEGVKDAAEIVATGNGFHKQAEVYEKWKDWHASEISHHGSMCCDIAREWVTGTDLSELGGGSKFTGPRWLRQKFNWGASSFPIFWCEAVRKKTLDCGAHAALAYEVFNGRGVKAYRVQMVQRFSEIATAQWFNSWNLGEGALPWTHGDLIYHEGCAIAIGGDEIKVWDASAGWWIDPKSREGYGALLALRISKFGLPPETTFSWGNKVIPADGWISLRD